MRYLNLENNRITNIDELGYLPYLHELNLKKNSLKTPFALEKPLVCMKYLKILKVQENDLCKTEKWRDCIVMMALAVEELNSKKILKHEREFLFRLHKKKK